MEKKNLVEIKKGEEGTGLLIEQDGYISSDCGNNKQLFEDINSRMGTSEPVCPDHFIVSAVFQKFGIENANGRIYPEAILKREVEKYQEKIAGNKFGEKRAIGECYTPDAMVLCEKGWKPISDVEEGDNVLTLNTSTDEIEIQKVSKKIRYDYDGDMIRLQGRHINELVTPNHGYPIYSRYGKFSGFYTSNDILNGDVKDCNHSFIPKRGEWVNRGEDFFILKKIENPSSRMLKNHPDCCEDKKIPMSTFMKFMGIYLSEGDFSKSNNDVRIYQKKEDVCSLIDEMLIELDIKYTIRIDKRDTHIYRLCDPRLHEYVKLLGNCYTKYIPFEIKQQSKENLRILYDWFVLGDGRVRGDKRRDSKLTDDVFSVSKQLVLDLNEIQLKIGYSGTYHIESRNQNRMIEGRLIEGKNCKEMHFSLRSLSSGIYLDKRFLDVKKEYYKGEVMCIEVPNHTFYVMVNGKSHWSKNCNHPSESVIDLSRVAMNIIELHWEGRTLVGKLEILTSPGFRKYGIISCQGDQVANLLLQGIKIGVSSRGLGTVTNKMGVLYVDEDYEIVCWDVVSEPSTPNAWITTEDNIPQQYVESKENSEGKDKIFEELDKFKDWLND